MLNCIKVLCHSSIKITGEKTIYVDPFKIDKDYNDADLIFITHSHYDHYSEEDIERIRKDDTTYIVTKDVAFKLQDKGVSEKSIFVVEPNKEYEIDGIKFETIPAYNINKQFHPKNNNWIGYIIEIKGIRYYIAGDTDITPENSKVECDVALVPVGGTYTMTYKEAAELINKIKPKVAIPIHYGSIVGTNQDAKRFVELLDEKIEGKILM